MTEAQVTQSVDKVTYAPVKAPGLGKQILESDEDPRRILAAFRKRIGIDPLTVYGVGLNWNNVVTFTDAEPLQSGEEGDADPFEG